MSFWGGMARGFKDASEKKERDQAVGRQQERLDIEDARYESETARADRYRSEDVTFRTQELKTRREQLAHDRRMAEQREARLTQDQEFQETVVWAHTVKMADYDESRDVIFDLRADRGEALKEAQLEFTKERAIVGDEQALKQFDLRLSQFAEQQRAAKVSEANWNKSFEAQQENIDREWLNKVEMQDYSQSRDVVSDLRADAQVAAQAARDLFDKEKFEVGTAMAKKQFDLRMKQFDEQLRATNVSEEDRKQAFANSNEQWAKGYQLQVNADTRAQEAAEINRVTKLLDAMPPGLASLLGGGVPPKGGSTVMSTDAITEGATVYENEYQNLSEEAKNSEFFKMLKGDRGAQASMMGFIEAQGIKGNTINLEELPKYFKYAGTIEGQGEAEALEVLEMITSGEGIKDAKSLARGLVAFNNLKTTKHLFIQTDAPGTITDASKNLTYWEEAVTADANLARGTLEGEDKEIVTTALAMLERKENRPTGLAILAKYGFGAGAVQAYGMGDDPVIKSYYGNSPPVKAATPTGGVVPEATGTLPAASTPQTTVPATEGTNFKDWAAVTAAREGGFSGTAIIDGSSYTVAPLEVPAQDGPEGLPGGPEVIKRPPEGPEVVNDETGFLGTGYQDTAPDMDTSIDAMFNEVSPDEPLPAPTSLPGEKRAPIEDVDMDAAVSDIEKSSEATDIEAVIEDIEGVGIKWPINREELGNFRDDLKALVYEMEVEVPDEVLFEVIKRASENALKGETMQPQVNDPSEPTVKQSSGTDNPVTPSGALAKGSNELNRSEKTRISRALRAGDDGLVDNLIEKFGEDAINKVREEMGL